MACDANSSIVPSTVYHHGTWEECGAEDQEKVCHPNIYVGLCILPMHLESFYLPFCFLSRGHYTGSIVKAMWDFFLYRYVMNSGNIIFCTVKDNRFSLPLKLVGFHYHFH